MVAVAVRLANTVITTHSVNIKSGHLEMDEYKLAENLDISDANLNLKHQGWARRPQWGVQYGRSYLEPYKRDIKQMFDRGACVSTEKMSPWAMLEALQILYPVYYSLPGENEIRTEISRLFGKKKVSSEEAYVGGNDSETEFEPHGRRGRKGILSNECIKYLEDLVQETPSIKPADALRHVKAALSLPNSCEYDKAIKSKVSTLKSRLKAREKSNIFLTQLFYNSMLLCSISCIVSLPFINVYVKNLSFCTPSLLDCKFMSMHEPCI